MMEICSVFVANQILLAVLTFGKARNSAGLKRLSCRIFRLQMFLARFPMKPFIHYSLVCLNPNTPAYFNKTITFPGMSEAEGLRRRIHEQRMIDATVAASNDKNIPKARKMVGYLLHGQLKNAVSNANLFFARVALNSCATYAGNSGKYVKYVHRYKPHWLLKNSGPTLITRLKVTGISTFQTVLPSTGIKVIIRIHASSIHRHTATKQKVVAFSNAINWDNQTN